MSATLTPISSHQTSTEAATLPALTMPPQELKVLGAEILPITQETPFSAQANSAVELLVPSVQKPGVDAYSGLAAESPAANEQNLAPSSNTADTGTMATTVTAHYGTSPSANAAQAADAYTASADATQLGSTTTGPQETSNFNMSSALQSLPASTPQPLLAQPATPDPSPPPAKPSTAESVAATPASADLQKATPSQAPSSTAPKGLPSLPTRSAKPTPPKQPTTEQLPSSAQPAASNTQSTASSSQAPTADGPAKKPSASKFSFPAPKSTAESNGTRSSSAAPTSAATATSSADASTSSSSAPSASTAQTSTTAQPASQANGVQKSTGPSLPARRPGSSTASAKPSASQLSRIQNASSTSVSSPQPQQLAQQPASAPSTATQLSRPPATSNASHISPVSGSRGVAGGTAANRYSPSTSSTSNSNHNGLNSQSGSSNNRANSSTAAAGSSSRSAPSLPVRANEVQEPEPMRKMRDLIQNVRVQMIRCAQRLGYDKDNAMVMQVLYRLNLAERIKAPLPPGVRRVDKNTTAAREAAALDAQAGTGAKLGLTIKILLIGMKGSGKTQLAHSMLGRPTVVDPFNGATPRVQLVQGEVSGIGMQFIDTPGLEATAGAEAYNLRVLQQIGRAFNKHKPDLVMYVERLDAPSRGKGNGGGTCELPVLQLLTQKLGAEFWLNTIVVFSHAGTRPLPRSWEQYITSRSTAVQKMIRMVSGDQRLMNPTAFAESHPHARTNADGQVVVGNDLPWKAHTLLMSVSAKLLADAEAFLHGPQDKQQASRSAQEALMAAYGSRQMPVPYLLNQMLQFSRPLKFPQEHRQIKDIRRMRRELDQEVRRLARQQQVAKRNGNPRDRVVGNRRLTSLLGFDRLKAAEQKRVREQTQKLAYRTVQLKRTAEQANKMREYFSKSISGGRHLPRPPRTATKVVPSHNPAPVLKLLEPTGGWTVRPNIERHGPDGDPGLDGLTMEKFAVARGGLQDPFGGAPYHVAISAQVSKDQQLVNLRSESTLYHGLLGKYTSSLSADVQTSTSLPGMTDTLAVGRWDLRAKHTPLHGNKATVGAMVGHLMRGSRVMNGPLAVGLRLQDSAKAEILGLPTELGLTGGYIQPLSLADGSEDASDKASGANMELTADLQRIFGTRHSLPLKVGMTMLNYKGTSNTSFGAQCKVAGRGRDGVLASYSHSGSQGARLSIKVVSGDQWWMGLIAMGVPISNYLLEVLQLKR